MGISFWKLYHSCNITFSLGEIFIEGTGQGCMTIWLSQMSTNPALNFGLTLLEVKPVSDFHFQPEIRVRQVLVFPPLVANMFQHGFRGVKPSKMVGFQVFKDPNDKMLFSSCPDGPKNYLKCCPNHHIKARSVPKLDFHEMCRN